MAFSDYHVYVGKLTLPSGELVLTLKTVTRPTDAEGVKRLHAEFDRSVSQNPDAKVDYASIRYVGRDGEPTTFTRHDEAVKELKASFTDPETGEGVDRLNRLLADPNLSRERAEAKQVQGQPSEV